MILQCVVSKRLNARMARPHDRDGARRLGGDFRTQPAEKPARRIRGFGASAAATKRLAAPDSYVLALLGSGVQAAAHLEALRLVRPIDEVRVWSRTPEHAERFAAQHGATAMAAERAVRWVVAVSVLVAVAAVAVRLAP